MRRPITAFGKAPPAWQASVACLTALGLVLTFVNSSVGAEGQTTTKSQQHGGLGVSINNSQQSVVVVGIVPGSPAELAGLQWGDEIFYVAEHRIRTTQDLTKEVSSFKPGAQVELVIRRNGQRLVVAATLGVYESIFNPSASRTSYSFAPRADATADPQQQVRALQRQVFLLNQEVNQLRSSQNTNAQDVNDILEWYNRGQRGATGNDPAVMQ